MSQQSISAAAPPDARRPPPKPRVASTTPRAGFSVAIGRALGLVVVTVHGTLDTSTCARFEHVLEDLIDAQGNLAVAVDLRDLTWVDPGGLAVLRGAAVSAAMRGGELILADPCDAVHRALDATGLAPAVSFTGCSTPLRGRCVPSEAVRHAHQAARPGGLGCQLRPVRPRGRHIPDPWGLLGTRNIS